MIPDWNISRVLPPIRPGKLGSDRDRSPYLVNLHHAVTRFATSDERSAILDGLLRFRNELHTLGLVEGFQWLDGSFMEEVEVLESRPPKDVDVVTFFYLPEGLDQLSLFQKNPELFDSEKTKEKYHVDAYFYVLGEPTTSEEINLISYWYSMWSHRRNWAWKGFLQVDLSPLEDEDASAALTLAQ